MSGSRRRATSKSSGEPAATIRREPAQRSPAWGARVTCGTGGLLFVGALFVDAGCVELRSLDEQSASVNDCIRCHGAPRAGSVERQAAPPLDLEGNTEIEHPGVGAHEVHSSAAATHGPVPCAECHQVPLTVDTPGHTDSAAPAEFVPGLVASLGRGEPRYDAETHSCAGVYCHGTEQPVWIAPRSSEQACGTCHTLPPKLPHEQVDDCDRCHPAVVAADRSIIDASRHVNGGVDVVGECYDCHGTPVSYAPPPDTHGATDVVYVGVGAHEVHVQGTANSRPAACSGCHVVPAEVGAVGHIDGGRAEVTFAGVPLTEGRTPTWDPETRRCSGGWCHGPSSDTGVSSSWTVAGRGPLACDACHGMPPPPPHTLVANCPNCHDATVGGLPPDVTVHSRDRHVNGVVDFSGD